MSDPIVDYQSAPVNPGGMPTAHHKVDAIEDNKFGHEAEDVQVLRAHDVYDGAEGIPTEEELKTLRLVSAPIS